MKLRESSLSGILGRLLCAAGIHDYRVIEASFSFGGVSVEKVECRRCGRTTTRQSR